MILLAMNSRALILLVITRIALPVVSTASSQKGHVEITPAAMPRIVRYQRAETNALTQLEGQSGIPPQELTPEVLGEGAELSTSIVVSGRGPTTTAIYYRGEAPSIIQGGAAMNVAAADAGQTVAEAGAANTAAVAAAAAAAAAGGAGSPIVGNAGNLGTAANPPPIFEPGPLGPSGPLGVPGPTGPPEEPGSSGPPGSGPLGVTSSSAGPLSSSGAASPSSAAAQPSSSGYPADSDSDIDSDTDSADTDSAQPALKRAAPPAVHTPIQGAPGPEGAPGHRGHRGHRGSQGEMGDLGHAGHEGIQGPIGHRGPPGPPNTANGATKEMLMCVVLFNCIFTMCVFIKSYAEFVRNKSVREFLFGGRKPKKAEPSLEDEAWEGEGVEGYEQGWDDQGYEQNY